MEFIELSGKQLLSILHAEEYQMDDIRNCGIKDDTQVRINRQGDIEVRRDGEWDVVGGLLGSFAQRIAHVSGLKWKAADA
jgi:hypothetical protein